MGVDLKLLFVNTLPRGGYSQKEYVEIATRFLDDRVGWDFKAALEYVKCLPDNHLIALFYH